MSSRDEYAMIRSAYIRILYSSMQVAGRMCINMQASHASMNTYGYMHTEDIIRIQISLRICKKYICRHRHADFIVTLTYSFDYSDLTCYS